MDRKPISKSFTTFYTFDPTDPSRYHHRVVDADYFDWLFENLAGTGLTFLYRCNLAGRAYYPSRLMAPFDEGCIDPSHDAAPRWRKVVDMMSTGDPLASAVKAARKHGVPIWIWWNWNEFQCIRKGCLSLIDPVWYDRPRKYWCSRDGSRFYHGVPDFGDEEVCDRLLGLLDETLSYGVDGAYLSTRSHSWFACWPSPGWDAHLEPFGFNDSIVEAYRARHGVDIRYEDYDEDAWLRIKGEQFTGLIAAAGEQIHARGLPFVVGISPDRYDLMGISDKWPGKKHLRLYKDWERWVAGGSIDGLCSEQTCPHYSKMEASPIDLFRDTLPADFPLYLWFDTAWFNNRGAGPFAMENWDALPVEQVMQQINMAEAMGVAGAFLHSMYQYTAADSGGMFVGVKPEGYGILPRTEYFDALRQRNRCGVRRDG